MIKEISAIAPFYNEEDFIELSNTRLINKSNASNIK